MKENRSTARRLSIALKTSTNNDEDAEIRLTEETLENARAAWYETELMNH